MPRRISGPSATVATSLTGSGVPFSVLSTNFLQIGHGLDVAAAAHHVLASRQFHQAAAHVVVALADGLDHDLEGSL
jgi:hypothetical protein